MAVDTKATDQATLEPEVNAALAATKAAAAVAPADYADIATATVTQEEAVIALLQKYGWNFATALASDDGNAFFTSPDYSAVTAKRDAYLQQHCDLAPATAGTSGADVVLSPGDAGIRQLFQLLQIGGQLDITDDQIDCLVTELSGKITDADLDAIGKGKTVTDAGTAAFVAALSTCGAVPTA
ncbi:MAG: hypothetical protein JWM34_996 [Ilumatobacteraceae bacterium]|nr:hypothetical protein [Ilumatobacteraceae bacterium]